MIPTLVRFLKIVTMGTLRCLRDKKPVESMATKKTLTGSHCTATRASKRVPSSITPAASQPSTSTTAQRPWKAITRKSMSAWYPEASALLASTMVMEQKV